MTTQTNSTHVWLAFREDDEGTSDYLGVATTPETARQLCETAEQEAADQRTQIGVATINADHSVTTVPHTYTCHLVWAHRPATDATVETYTTTDASEYAWGSDNSWSYMVVRDTLRT